MKSELNVFTYGYDCCRFFERPIQFFHNLKYAWQRATRGYCDRDIWNLDTFYSDLFYQTLNKLADDTNGYPGIEPWETPEKWEEYLRKMASLFKSCEMEASDRYTEKFEHFLEFNESERKDWVELENRIFEEQIKEKDEAFYMMKEAFFSLWW